jgi:UDP-N-acetylmuramoyl-tripeptide--D-alanyl-D-alanine ligase
MAGGHLNAGGQLESTGFSIDTRSLAPREVFIAIVGERHDAHQFVSAAAARHAAAAIVSKPVKAPPGFALIRVDDTLAALGRVGHAFRTRWPLTVVTVTGSAGKTTTKEFTAELLSHKCRVFRSEGNLNNLYGLPLSLTRRRPEHVLAVLEAGMSTPGELGRIAAIAAPDVAVITNVGRAHHMNFPDQDAIAAEKASLLDHTRPDGGFVANADDPRVLAMTERFDGRVVRFGFGEQAELRASDVKQAGPGGMSFLISYGGRSVQTSIGGRGRHHVANALAALGAATALGHDPLALASRLPALTPGSGRGRLLRLGDDILVLDDCYNANPEAMLAAAEALAGGGRKVAVLGDMLELGEEAETAHEQVGRRLGQLEFGLLIGVGPLMARAVKAAREAGVPEVQEASDRQAAVELTLSRLKPGDRVLVKGSRGIGLELVVAGIEERFGSR